MEYLLFMSIVGTKRSEETPCEFHIKDYDFILTVEALRSTRLREGVFRIDLDKGCRRLGGIEEAEVEGGECALRGELKVKAYKERSAEFSWSIYRLLGAKLEFLDTCKFSLLPSFTNYVGELKPYSFEYSRLAQLKAHHFAAPAWKTMKAHLKNWKVRETVSSSLGDIAIDFSIEIRGEYDYLPDPVPSHKRRGTLKPGDLDDEGSIHSVRRRRSEASSQILRGVDFGELRLESILKESGPPEPGEGEIKSPRSMLQTKKASAASPRQFLSDIIEASHEAESNLISQKTIRKSNQPQAPSHQNHVKNFFKANRSHTLDATCGDGSLKRNQSLELQEESEHSDQWEKVTTPKTSAISKVDDLIVESTNHTETTQSEESRPFSLRYLLLIALAYVMLVVAVGPAVRGRLRPEYRLIRGEGILEGKKGRIGGNRQ